MTACCYNQWIQGIKESNVWLVSSFSTMPFQTANLSVHDEIHQITASEDTARSYLQVRGVLKSSLSCSCSTSMNLIPCSVSKSSDLFIWKCPTCKKYKNIRTDSVLAGTKISYKSFLTLIFYFRMKSSPLKHAVKQMRKDGILLPSAWVVSGFIMFCLF